MMDGHEGSAPCATRSLRAITTAAPAGPRFLPAQKNVRGVAEHSAEHAKLPLTARGVDDAVAPNVNGSRQQRRREIGDQRRFALVVRIFQILCARATQAVRFRRLRRGKRTSKPFIVSLMQMCVNAESSLSFQSLAGAATMHSLALANSSELTHAALCSTSNRMPCWLHSTSCLPVSPINHS
mgnify:CR=1 FL=1